jgi:hypothetical protein
MKKSISTEMTTENISKVMELLTSTPQALFTLSQGFTPPAQTQPLKAGERSFIEIVAHILNCDERTTESIYAALLLNEPLILDIHPERQWGKLLRYEQFAAAELLTYFTFRRKALLRVLEELTEAQWARGIREMGKQRKESVYWRARGQALHEAEHLAQIETRFGTVKP